MSDKVCTIYSFLQEKQKQKTQNNICLAPFKKKTDWTQGCSDLMYPNHHHQKSLSIFIFCTVVPSNDNNLTSILPSGLKTKQLKPDNKGLLEGIETFIHWKSGPVFVLYCGVSTMPQMQLHFYHTLIRELGKLQGLCVGVARMGVCVCAPTRGTWTSAFSEAVEEACSQFSLAAGEWTVGKESSNEDFK